MFASLTGFGIPTIGVFKKMIAQLRGKISVFKELGILMEVNGIFYDVLLPRTIAEGIKQTYKEGDEIVLRTYHYLQSDPSRSIPVLIGFLNEIEREFFEKFITVSGVGPRAAVKSLSKPFSLVAQAIHEADLVFLKSLPGIGPQRAKEIIAKLQGKMGKYSLLKDQEIKVQDSVEKIDSEDVIKEQALAVLLQLQYKRAEAMQMVERIIKSNPSIKSCEELLNELYNTQAAER